MKTKAYPYSFITSDFVSEFFGDIYTATSVFLELGPDMHSAEYVETAFRNFKNVRYQINVSACSMHIYTI